MKNQKRIAALAVSALMLCTTALPSFAAVEASSGKEEVVYIMTDASGKTESVNVVNIFGRGEVVDYGDYSSVKMLTSETPITQNGDEITFTSDEDRVYYQGTLDDAQSPWDISIQYTLDGLGITPEELAGRSGALEIRFRVSRNEKYDGDFYDNYALQAAFTLDTENCTHIEAPDATQANVGKNRQLSYIILPGQGIDTTIRADVTDFEMDAVSINGVKMNFSLDFDDSGIKEQLGQIVSAVNEVDSGAQSLQDGAAQLEDATGQLSDATVQLNDGVGQIAEGASDLSDGLTAISSQSSTLNDGAQQAFEGLCTAAQTALNSQLASAGIDPVTLTPENYAETLDALVEKLNGMASGSGLLAGITASKVNAAVQQVQELKGQLDNFATFRDGVNTYTAAVDSAASGARQLDSALETLHQNTATLSGAASRLDNGMSQLAMGTRSLKSGTAQFAQQVAGSDSLVDEQIQNILSSLTGSDEVVSFVSEKNTDVSAVQFVIKTAAVEKAEEAVVEEEAEPVRTFWQKLLHLFGLAD